MPEAIPFIGPIEEVFLARPLSNGAMIGVFCSDHIILNLSVSAIGRHTTAGKNKSRNRSDRCPDPGNDLSALKPTAVVTESHVQARRLPVLIDISESMSIKDQRKSSKILFLPLPHLAWFRQRMNWMTTAY